MYLGKLLQIWRYPVKSMGGECIDTAVISSNGLAGDRCWAVIDADTREICHAKRWPELLNFRASLRADEGLLASGYGDEVPNVDIHCPGGSVLVGRDTDIEQQLSSQLKRPAGLAPLAHPGDRDHYRLANARTEESIAKEMQLLPNEPVPDFFATPEEIMLALAECVTPPGTYVDAFPLHLMTSNSLTYLAEQGGVDAVVQRYRPNLLIEPTEQTAKLSENGWLDYRVQLGEAILHIHSRTIRCSMPSREQQWCNIKAEKTMTRAMVDHCERHLGVNVMIEKGGSVSTGDELVLLN